MEVCVRGIGKMSLLRLVVKKLLDLLLYCFKIRRDHEKCMHVLLVDNYLAASIRIVRELRGLCGKVQSPDDLQMLSQIGVKVECELDPTAAAVGLHGKANVIQNLGDKFVEKLEELLELCLGIDRNTPSRVSIHNIESQFRKVECLWDDMVQIYLNRVSPLVVVEREVKRKVLDVRIAQAVSRSPRCGGK